jgi:L-serine/L-threonine ammonia-lyase
MNQTALHMKTPLARTAAASGATVWLKMEHAQPSGSFKLRGIGHACAAHVARGAARLVTSSGGNAGLAVAYSAQQLATPALVVVPENAPARAIEKIRAFGADVDVHGASWQEAHEEALTRVGSGAYIHPFDDPLVWAGHATLMDEVVADGVRPDAVVLSVGGGGLLCGIAEGMMRNGLGDTPIIAVETVGAHSLAASVTSQEHVTLPAITSLANTLGAKRVADAAFALTQSAARDVRSLVVTDAAAVDACLRLHEDHTVVVEPACGAALAPVYAGSEVLAGCQDVLVVVCGGTGVTLDQLNAWQTQLAAAPGAGASDV